MKKVYYSWKDVQGAVIDIARQLQQDNWKPDYIVGITRGGLIPATLLSQYLGAKCTHWMSAYATVLAVLKAIFGWLKKHLDMYQTRNLEILE